MSLEFVPSVNQLKILHTWFCKDVKEVIFLLLLCVTPVMTLCVTLLVISSVTSRVTVNPCWLHVDLCVTLYDS